MKISLDKKLLNKIPRSREMQKQQIGEPALQQLQPSETLFSNLHCLRNVDSNNSGIKFLNRDAATFAVSLSLSLSLFAGDKNQDRNRGLRISVLSFCLAANKYISFALSPT